MNGCTDRASEVFDAVAVLARHATLLHDGRMATKLDKIGNAVNKHEALAKILCPGSELAESVRALMQAAAADPATYRNPLLCAQMATAQTKLRLPCSEFWNALPGASIPWRILEASTVMQH
jgi:hypothetical protein